MKSDSVWNPFKLTGPTCLSFSGGRTSAYMLWMVILSNSSEDIARWLIVCFANTGKEREETLRFVQRCCEQWSIAIVWLEFCDSGEGFRIVDFDSASRNGEPFEAAIRKRQYLPNPVTRYCTVELKIRTMHRYLKSLGWAANDGEWDQMVGIRADEHRRVAKIRARGTSTETQREHMRLPLADAGVTVRDIEQFWLEQPFRLELPTVNGKTLLGNCDLCFLKGRQQVYSIIQSDIHSADWWASMERLGNGKDAAYFRKDRPSYSDMQAYARAQHVLFETNTDDAVACFCGD